VTSSLSELRDELDYLAASVRLSRETTGTRTALHSSLIRRVEQVKAAIRIERESNPWRTQPVYVVARNRREAVAIAKLTGWDTRKQAHEHLQIVQSAVSSNWVTAQSYRIFRIRIFRRKKKSEIISALPAMLTRRPSSVKSP
jgi:hypothetical protein